MSPYVYTYECKSKIKWFIIYNDIYIDMQGEATQLCLLVYLVYKFNKPSN